jgi:hypothetical protein
VDEDEDREFGIRIGASFRSCRDGDVKTQPLRIRLRESTAVVLEGMLEEGELVVCVGGDGEDLWSVGMCQ